MACAGQACTKVYRIAAPPCLKTVAHVCESPLPGFSYCTRIFFPSLMWWMDTGNMLCGGPASFVQANLLDAAPETLISHWWLDSHAGYYFSRCSHWILEFPLMNKSTTTDFVVNNAMTNEHRISNNSNKLAPAVGRKEGRRSTVPEQCHRWTDTTVLLSLCELTVSWHTTVVTWSPP